MLMRPRLRLLPAALLIAGLAFGAVAKGQGHGHMPAGVPAFGPPAWANIPSSQGAAAATSSHAAFGLERAELAQTQRLSRQQTDRAAAVAKVAPQAYELDRNGALAIRGEVLASGLDAVRLARIEKAGFSVVRRNEVPELGVSLFVLTHAGMSAARALDQLRRIDPDGTYDVNHIFFEGGRHKIGRPAALAPMVSASASTPAASRRGTVVGLIDTGVAGVFDNVGRVHLQRRNFAPTQGVPGLHGTAVAALLARAPGVITIYAADIFGVGPRGGTTELLVRALAWMAGERVPVINVSMVGPANALLAPIIRTMIDRGFTIVAPVGNDGAAARPLFPASYPGVIAVSAADAAGQLLPEASRVRRVDFVGPGIATVPDPAGRATTVRGTSFAAPIISRDIADQVHMPDPDAARQAIARLSRSAVRPKSGAKWFGHGMIGVAGP
jgi:hypothetical protein